MQTLERKLAAATWGSNARGSSSGTSNKDSPNTKVGAQHGGGGGTPKAAPRAAAKVSEPVVLMQTFISGVPSANPWVLLARCSVPC